MRMNHTAVLDAEDLSSVVSDRVPTSEDVRAIGDILRDMRDLTADQVAQILECQRTEGLRFGEAAISLGLVTPDDVLQALSQQFNYAYATEEQRRASPELIALNQPFGHQAEAFRMIRSQVQMRMKSAEGKGVLKRRAIAIVSPNAGDGKTFFAANLAVALAQLGERTLVVDADLRSPRLHEVFNVPGTTGLSGVLTGRRGDGVIHSVAAVPNLFVLPVGIAPPNPLELIEGPAFALLLQELASRFEHVIVDTPAAEYGADSLVIASRCGHALLLARKHKARVDDVQELAQMLVASGTTLSGVALNEF